MSYGRTEAGVEAGAPDAGPAGDEQARGAPDDLAFVRFLFRMFVTGVVVRLLLTDVIVNLLWPYTSDGGFLPTKIHPGSYLIFLSAGLLYLSPGYRFATADFPLLRAFIVFGAGMVLAAMVPIFQGRSGPAGYVIDVYLVAVAGGLFLMSMPPAWRQKTLMAILYALCVNAFFAAGEFATGRYIIPFEAAEFRPTAFLGAALNVGVIHLTAILLTISLPIHAFKKYLIVAILAFGILMSASRTAMLLALVTIPLAVIMTARLRREGLSAGATGFLMALFGGAILPALFFGVSELGFLDRFKGGYIDDSAQTRIEIYGVFDYVSWSEIIWGKDILAVRRIAKELLGIQFIESAIVFFIFDFGLIATLLFAAVLLYLLWSLIRDAHPVTGLALVVFLVLALTNNTLSTKVPSAFIAIIMAVASRAFDSRRT